MKIKKVSLLIDYIEIVVKWWKFIFRNVIAITVGAAIISLLLVQKYTATTTMLPPSQETNMMLNVMATGLPGGLSNIPGISSMLPGLTSPSDLYAAILRSGRIRGQVIKEHNLKEIFKTRTMHDTYKTLDEITQISISMEGIVSVSITYKDKYLAADLANTYLEKLDEFNTETAMTAGKKFRIFIEERLKESSDSLVQAEEVFRKFQEKHHTIALDVEVEKAIETIAELKSQIILLEVKKGALTSSSQTSNPYLHSINRELRELKKQLLKIEFGQEGNENKGFGAGFSVPFSELPEVSLEYARLLRDLKVQEVIFELLFQQYEQAKIMELKDTPTVQILDYASPPEKKSYPKRSVIVILVFIASIAANILTVFVIEYIGEEKSKERSNVNRVILLLTQIKSDLVNALRKFKK